MIYISGFLYILALMVLGVSLRFFFLMITKSPNQTYIGLDFFTHSFFQGTLSLIIVCNSLQFIELSNSNVKIIFMGLMAISLMVVIKGFLSLQVQFSHLTFRQFILVLITLLSAILINLNAADLPNIAWDSWVVWEGRANQWIEHGLSINIANFQAWLNSSSSIYNQSANYPEGLSLIYYVPKLFFQSAFHATHLLYLFAYGLTVLMIQKHIKEIGASVFLQLFLILIAFTLPLMNNHLMITGYADIWIAIVLVLVILAYIDYSTQPTKAALITLLGYVFLLPMFKLEGWVWLILLFIAHLITLLKANKNAKLIAFVLFILLALTTIIDINFSTPIGQLILSNERVNIFSLVDSPIKFNNISDLLMSGLFWQNNWSLIWLGLPFLLVSFIVVKQDKTSNTIHLFFTLSILSFLFLFYFTKASQWAQDFTAVNRIVLQLTPCYLLLLFRMLTRFEISSNKKHQHLNNQ